MPATPQHTGLDRGLVTATSLGFAVVQLDVSVVNVAIRPISDALGGGVRALQWVVGAYTITFAALILTCGSLGDRIGATDGDPCAGRARRLADRGRRPRRRQRAGGGRLRGRGVRAQGMSPLHAGLAFAPMTVVVFVVNILAGRHSSGRAARPLVVVGALLLAIGSLGLLGAGTGTPYLALVVQLIAVGAGLGLIVPIITAALLGSVEPARAGVAAGTLNSARQSGSVIGVAVCGSLAAQGLVTGLHDSLLLCAAVAVVVLLLARGLRPGG